MKKHGDNLFKIGEVAKILGVTRKAILLYEDMGLLTPAVKDEKSGFRYYTADNMTQIRSIKSLQALGLSLKEVAEYYYDTKNMDKHLHRLLDLRDMLDRNIQMLQVRSARQGDLTIHKTVLPRQVCFVRRYSCADVAEAANKLRDTYIAAARNCRKIMKSDLSSGDLVFFNTSRKKRKGINHVGLFLKNGYFIHASTSRGVIISNLKEDYYRKTWKQGGRVK